MRVWADQIKSKSVRDMRKGMIESYGEFVETHIDGFMAKSADVFEIKTYACGAALSARVCVCVHACACACACMCATAV